MSEEVKVIKVGAFDTSGNEKDSIVITGWVLDAVLDPSRIENAYAQLVEHWPLLSARLRQEDSTGVWVYHLPHKFTEASPRYVFKTLTKPGSIHDHYNYSKPSPDRITCTIKENQDYLFSLDGPRSVKDFISKDIPVVQLQLTIFDDASIVGLTTPHVLCDGHGNKEIARALGLILKGDAPHPLPENDPFRPYSKDVNTKPFTAPPYWKVFTALQSIIFFFWLLWDFAVNRDIENRELFFPTDEAERIKEQAMNELKTVHGDNPDVWISTSDALIAFCLKLIHGPTKSKAPFNMIYSANMRRYLTSVVPSPYLHNGALLVVTPTIPLSDIATTSLGELAYMIRSSLQAQIKSDHIENWLRWRIANAGKLCLFFEPHGAWNVVTNWRDMKLMEVDFSGALPSIEGVQVGKNVRCVYVYGNSFQPFLIRNCMGLVADDPRGGIWMGGFFDKSVWERKDGFGQFI